MKNKSIILKLFDEIPDVNGVTTIGTPSFYKGKYLLSDNSLSLIYLKDKKEIKDNEKYAKGVLNMPENNVVDYDACVIGDRFGLKLKEPSELRNKFDEAVKGEGFEWKKIRRIHSSSLCGFLHFCNINEKNKFYVNPKFFSKSDIRVKGEDLVFDHVKFEFENKCIEGHKPSSVDVVLYNDNTILFVELKFLEYLNPNPIDVSNDYLNEYKLLLNNNKDYNRDEDYLIESWHSLKIGKSKEKGKFSLEFDSQVKNPNKFYIGGIKQMLSHTIGIRNFINNPNKVKFKNVLYMEVAFSFKNFNNISKNISNKFTQFNEAYIKVKNKIVEFQKNEQQQIIFSDSLTSYEDLFGYKNNLDLLTPEALKFYKYKN